MTHSRRLIAATLVPAAMLLASCGSPSSVSPAGLEVSRAKMGEDWPLTVPQATVVCGKANRLLLEVGGTTYWLNGLAKGDHKWADLFGIWADNPDVPGLKKSMGPLTDKALAFCQAK